jgi:hypothetical protein
MYDYFEGYNINVYEREDESWDLSNYLQQQSGSRGSFC